MCLWPHIGNYSHAPGSMTSWMVSELDFSSYLLPQLCFLMQWTIYTTVHDVLDSHNNLCELFFLFCRWRNWGLGTIYIDFLSSYIYRVSQDLNTRLGDAKTRTLIMVLSCLYILCLKLVAEFFFLTLPFKLIFEV